jgi:uncharacterized protein
VSPMTEAMTTDRTSVPADDDRTVVDPRTPGRRASGWMVAAIHGYQLLRSGRPTGCRFIPTCSEYAIQAIEDHGAVHGGALAARRLMRCTPWGGHGVDPVPDGRTSCSHP